MRNITEELKNAIIDGRRSVLVKIVRKDGTVYAYTDHDVSLEVDGISYVPSPGLQRVNLTAAADDVVSNQEFASAWVDAPEEELLAGLFDNAEITTALCSWENPAAGQYIVDKGNLGVIQWTIDGFRADVQNHMRNLMKNIGFLYTANCRHTLFGQFGQDKIGACTLNKASYTWNGSVTSVTTPKLAFATTNIGQPAGYCSSGTITWTTGPNTGVQSPVKKQLVGSIELMIPTPFDISETDTFEITAGCDKTLDTCKAKFNNVINFGGFPHIQVEVSTR